MQSGLFYFGGKVRRLNVILGIDPAVSNAGYGIIFYNNSNKKVEDIKYGMYPVKSTWPMEEKIYVIYTTTALLIRENDVDELVIENVFHNPKRARGSVKVREAIGAIKVAAVQEGVPIYSYTAQQVKKQVGGHGKCSKEDLANKVSELSGLDTFTVNLVSRKQPIELVLSPGEMIDKKLDHVTDAIAIAYCRLFEKIKEVH
jgi:crossover junction endodeoxyribonuclease RuvC